jgi:hypothetical protein
VSAVLLVRSVYAPTDCPRLARLVKLMDLGAKTQQFLISNVERPERGLVDFG